MSNRNDKDILKYGTKAYSPIDDFSQWYEENGKHNESAKPDQDYSELANQEIEKGNLDNVPTLMKIAYGLDKLQKAKEAEQAKKNKKSDQ